MDQQSVAAFDTKYISVCDDELLISGTTIRLLQWNIFAQAFVGLDEFVYCSKDKLHINDRLAAITREVAAYSPDIICLQEADIHQQLMQALSDSPRTTAKYSKLFLPKVCSPCLSISDNYGPDGLATYYRSDKLTCTKQRSILLHNAMQRAALLTFFEVKATGETFAVINLHLKARKSEHHFRLLEGNNLVAELRNLCAESSERPLALLISGDFNAEPHEMVLQLLRQLSLPKLKLQSAFATAGNGQEPEFTTWKMKNSARLPNYEVKHTVDYIWYSLPGLTLKGVVALPDSEQLAPNALPLPNFPSDHLSLIADFALTQL